ncbi:MAG: crossover junction endodeoxyribonuclease RuvC [Maricaulaceae bacterium]
MTATIRIFGVDPGLNRCGWGVVEHAGARLSYGGCGVIKPVAQADMGQRLLSLKTALAQRIGEYACDTVAVEDAFVSVNAASAMKLGLARAAALLAAAEAGLSVGEYAPRLVKKAVVGAGGADKDQVAFMVRRLLPAAGAVSADAADALAVAITHAHWRNAAKAGSRA